MSTTQARKIFVNLPVKDLERSVAFFTALGFGFDARFTDQNATCMIVNDDAYVMLLVEPFFQTFTKKPISDAATDVEAILALSADSREQVDHLVGTALASGGTPANDNVDHGFMYSGSFYDPDGHMWEVMWMDMDAAVQQQAAS